MAVRLDAALAASKDLRLDTRTARLASGDSRTAGGLPAGSYVARLQVVEAAALDGGAAMETVYSTLGGLAAIAFILNPPPAYGRLTISPRARWVANGDQAREWLSGEAMSTRFTLFAPGWRDEDAPLTYLFWYQNVAAASAARIPLAPAGEASALEGVLLISGELKMGVSVTDNHGAVTDFISDELAVMRPYAQPAATLLGALDQASEYVSKLVS